MAKEFNTEGNCFADIHYLADTSRKMKGVMNLVNTGKYFIINRPRQYGKTTTLFAIAHQLRQTNEYMVFNISFEGVGDVVFADEKSFCQMLLELFEHRARQMGQTVLADLLLEESQQATTLKSLSLSISKMVELAGKKLVVLIDEVDKSSNNQLFVSFLAMLRNKYLNRHTEEDKTFHSVVLAGVHDVKTLKLKLRPEDERKNNSPWNIAAPFEVDMNLQPDEILPMLEDYMQERGVTMDAPTMSERLFFFTSGYPFLVSRLCKIMDEKLLPAKSEATWTDTDLETAVNMLTREDNTNFDSLINNLENYPELYRVVFSILMEGERPDYSIHDPTIHLGIIYGIFQNGNGVRIHNRIYQEVILNYMTSKVNREVPLEGYNVDYPFRLADNQLDMGAVLLQFQLFMKEQQSRHDQKFVERNGRLIFLAFLKPIINGGGWAFKEPQIGGEKRLDIAVTFFQHKYTIELKVWRGDVRHERGLKQLADYLDLQQQNEGYLLIFDNSVNKTWKQEVLEVEGKKVWAVWV